MVNEIEESKFIAIRNMDNFIEETQRMKNFIHSVSEGGSDIDWFIERNNCFVFFEMKKIRNGNIELYTWQMISLERLYKAIKKSGVKCSFFIIGFEDNEFGKQDNDVLWYFTMNQWLDGRSQNDWYRKIALYDEKFKKWNVSKRDIKRTTLREFRWLLEKTFEGFEKEN